jgi:phosphoserine phosphatase
MLTAPSWQPETPIDAVIFDCDGTLTAIEGIDELARMNHVGTVVEAMTAEAMSRSGLNPELYRQRLNLVLPRQEQVLQLADLYYQHRVPDSDAVIQLLQKFGKSIYIISAGLRPAVSTFGAMFSIPDANIFAVDISFDGEGKYLDFDAASPLATGDGKRTVVAGLQSMFNTLAYIGDGMNDFIVRDLATRFIGYGGIFYRENIAAGCEYYLKAKSLIALLPLLLTEDEVKDLDIDGQKLYNLGLGVILRQSNFISENVSGKQGRLLIG